MKIVGIHTGPDTYLDHLGVICSLLDVPLWVTEEKTFASAKTYYPHLNVCLKDHLELSLEYLAQNCDAILESGHYWAAELIPLFQLFFRKKMRIIYCPHGNSDKGHSLKNPVSKDISFVYGQHMLDLLKKTDSLEKLSSYVITGNYRYPFYLKHQKFYDALIPKTTDKTIFYAPTWSDGENPTSFFESCTKLIEETAPYFNLFIKLHPFLEEHYPAETHNIIQKHKTATFITDFPPIYPLLNHSDAYLGDFSSIGYDFLTFDKPMFFFHTSPLSDCGVVIPKNVDYGEFISNHWDQKHLSQVRKSRYLYTFESGCSTEKIKNQLNKILML